MARRFQVAILSDSRLFREAVSARLAVEDDVQIVSSASTIHNLLVRARGNPVDVLLVYPSGRSALPADIVWDVRMLLPASRVVALGCEPRHTGSAGQIEADTMTRLGQDTSYESVLESIRVLSRGRTGIVRRAVEHPQDGQTSRGLRVVVRRGSAGGWSRG